METQTHTNSVQTAKLSMFNLLFARRLALFFVGLIVMSYGIVSVVKAGFGVSPWDVLHLGIVQSTGLSFGRVQQLVGVVILASACLMSKKWPTLGAIANMIIVGEMCNWFLLFHLVPDWSNPAARVGLFIGGILFWGFGTGIYIQSNFGAGPRDWLMLALHEKTGWAIRWVRTILEVAAVVLGIWLGGPFNWGTIVFSFTIGHSTEYGIRLANRLFGRFTERREVA